MTVHLALRKDDPRLAGRLIRGWTGSRYSHCELLVDGWCYSSSLMDGGVRRKRIELDPAKWDLLALPWADAAAILRYFQLTDGHRYGWLTLFASQVFNGNWRDDDAQFCSEWCAAALGLPNPPTYSPGTLHDHCRHLGHILERLQAQPAAGMAAVTL